MPAIVHYEVYTYDVRGWTLQSRYPGDERDTAIHDAKTMEFSLNRPVRVIRETYYTDSNISDEVVTFVGRLKPPANTASKKIGGFGAPSAANAPFSMNDVSQAYGLGNTADRAKGTADFMFRLGMVMAASLGVAVLGTAVASLLFNRYSSLGIILAPSTHSLILFLIFLSLFLVTAVPLVMLYVPLEGFLNKTGAKKSSSFTKSGPVDLSKDPIPSEPPDEEATAYPRLNNPDEVVEAVMAAQAQSRGAGPGKGGPDDDPQARAEAERKAQQRAAEEKIEKDRRERERKTREKAAREQVDKDQLIANIAVGNSKETPAEKTKIGERWCPDEFLPLDPDELKMRLPGEEGWEDPAAADDDTQKDPAQQDADATSAEDGSSPEVDALLVLDQARLIIMKFLGGAVAAIKMSHPHLDAYNKFGVNLYLAGACTYLAEQKALSAEDRDAIISETVEVVGTRPEQARHLIGRMETYTNEPRYQQMINAGRLAMERQISGTGDPFMAISGVMKDWNTPQSQQVTTSTVTILFTDMVGSTDLTQSIGDAAAQDVIRAHNYIVRAALSHHDGNEVKHTGDGIMASFEVPANAIEAAIEIQQRAIEHNHKWPKLPLGLRIGMNTGEPIIEENDYFGTTVQIAARVCAAAGLGQIWCSVDTKALLPQSFRYPTFSHGPQRLKGVKAPHELFEIAWNDERQAELEAAASRLSEQSSTLTEPSAQSAPAQRPGVPSAAQTRVQSDAERRTAMTKAHEAAQTHLATTPPPPRRH